MDLFDTNPPRAFTCPRSPPWLIFMGKWIGKPTLKMHVLSSPLACVLDEKESKEDGLTKFNKQTNEPVLQVFIEIFIIINGMIGPFHLYSKMTQLFNTKVSTAAIQIKPINCLKVQTFICKSL